MDYKPTRRICQAVCRNGGLKVILLTNPLTKVKSCAILALILERETEKRVFKAIPGPLRQGVKAIRTAGSTADLGNFRCLIDYGTISSSGSEKLKFYKLFIKTNKCRRTDL